MTAGHMHIWARPSTEYSWSWLFRTARPRHRRPVSRLGAEAMTHQMDTRGDGCSLWPGSGRRSLPLDGTASPRPRASRLRGLASVSFRMAGAIGRSSLRPATRSVRSHHRRRRPVYPTERIAGLTMTWWADHDHRLPENGGMLEKAAQMENQGSARTRQMYDRVGHPILHPVARRTRFWGWDTPDRLHVT